MNSKALIIYRYIQLDISKHGLFCHNCNTLTSLYVCVWLACKPASPGVSRATGLKLIIPCRSGNISIDWLCHGYDQQFGSCYLCRPTANIRENRRDDSCEVGNTSISVCNFQSNCLRARNTDLFKLQFGMGYDELLADQLPTQFQCNLQPRDSVIVNRRTSNANTRHWRPDQTHCTHQDVKIPDY